jgi:hypothetical protein
MALGRSLTTQEIGLALGYYPGAYLTIQEVGAMILRKCGGDFSGIH